MKKLPYYKKSTVIKFTRNASLPHLILAAVVLSYTFSLFLCYKNEMFFGIRFDFLRVDFLIC